MTPGRMLNHVSRCCPQCYRHIPRVALFRIRYLFRRPIHRQIRYLLRRSSHRLLLGLLKVVQR